jgi:hypothetical protein
MNDETYLSGALRELADLEQPSQPPVDRLLHKGHRVRTTRNVGVAAVAVLAAVAIGIPLVAQGSGSSHGGGTVATASSPTGDDRPSLVLAAQKSSKTSFKVVWTVTDPGFGISRYEGAFDPVNQKSYQRFVPLAGQSQNGKFVEERRIGDQCYTLSSPGHAWFKNACMPVNNTDPTGKLLNDPNAVLERLKSDGLATYTGRKGSLDTWTFTYTVPARDPDPASTVTGTVTVDVSSNEIATVHIEQPTQSIPATVTYTYSDYGSPVTVTAPKI